MKGYKGYFLYFAWVIAFSGAILSFYFGEIQEIEPCHLCWYQRMALFPLVVLLGIAAYRDDRAIVLYALPFSFIGLFFALYQVIEPYVPFLQSEALCGRRGDCQDPVFLLFGVLSLPILSGLGFLAISFFLILARNSSEKV